MGLYLAAASLNQAALAQAQAHRAAVCWIGCAALFVVINLSGVMNPFRSVEVGFTASAAVLAVAALRALPQPARLGRGTRSSRAQAAELRRSSRRRRDRLSAVARQTRSIACRTA